MFQVTTLNLDEVPKTEDGAVDHAADFFGKPSNLTVSGQLEAELGAMALGKVYTFGPTFRAENSNTSRHLAEFWMIEPEVVNDLTDNMDLAEDCLRFVLTKVLERFPAELEFLAKREADIEKQLPADQRNEMGLIERPLRYGESPRPITYTRPSTCSATPSPSRRRSSSTQPVGHRSPERARALVGGEEVQHPVILTDYPRRSRPFTCGP